ncbi:hypothetical protein F0562_004827 [Nyssa sinensis]|uniref:Protein kinase domain-containing protein n=1 Tax=Nyssa sinensis TaxID=561372 RepID=A0A5J5AIW7_9ASTE|nr:hypothetical protein F0562_004827 [Nyssa sinensis]
MFHLIYKTLLHHRIKHSTSTIVRFLETLPISNNSNLTEKQSLTVSYLTKSCGLSWESAISASNTVHIETTGKPDSVLELLKSHGFSKKNIATLISRYPRLILANAEKTLRPKIEFFESLGIVGPDLPRFLCSDKQILLSSLKNQIIPTFDFLKTYIETNENLIYALKQSSRVVKCNIEKVMVPNIKTLLAQGVPESQIGRLIILQPRSLMLRIDLFEEVSKVVKEMGFNPRSRSFILAVRSMSVNSKLKWERKKEALMSFGWSESEFNSAFKVQPMCMICSEIKIRELMDFFVNRAGFKASDIAKCPNLFLTSLEKRIIPRCSVLQVLMSKGLIKENVDVIWALNTTKKRFEARFITKFEEVTPDVIKAYQGKFLFRLVLIREKYQNLKIAHLFRVFFIVVKSKNSQMQALLQLRKHLEYPLPLEIWENYSEDLCNLSSAPPMSITCQDNSVTELKIMGDKLAKISRLVKLHTLTLDSNFFNDTVPNWLNSFSNLTILSLKRNRLKGQFPSSICRITTLADIALSHNELSGKLPDLSTLTSLHLLDLRQNHLDSELPLLPEGLTTVLLSKNSLSGKIPDQFGKLNQLQHLDLSFNLLSGTPPSALFSLPNISYLNLASNMLSGTLPDHISCGGELGYVDISTNRLIGALPSCLDGTSNDRVVEFGGNCLSVDTQYQYQELHCKEANMERRQSWRKGIGVLVGVIGGTFIGMVLLAVGLFILYRRYCSQGALEQHTLPNVVQDDTPAGISSEILANARLISQSAKLGTQGAPVYQLFSLEELEESTNKFDQSTFLGEGSIGKLYKGRLQNGTYVAIRSLTLFRKYSIRNLKLRVFLIYEYVPNGNFRTHLSESCPERGLKWSDRLAILIGVAKAVYFLHAGVIPASFSNRLKTNNILLDEHWIAKLSDYGMSIITDEIEKLEAKGDGPKSW